MNLMAFCVHCTQYLNETQIVYLEFKIPKALSALKLERPFLCLPTASCVHEFTALEP